MPTLRFLRTCIVLTCIVFLVRINVDLPAISVTVSGVYFSPSFLCSVGFWVLGLISFSRFTTNHKRAVAAIHFQGINVSNKVFCEPPSRLAKNVKIGNLTDLDFEYLRLNMFVDACRCVGMNLISVMFSVGGIWGVL